MGIPLVQSVKSDTEAPIAESGGPEVGVELEESPAFKALATFSQKYSWDKSLFKSQKAELDNSIETTEDVETVEKVA